MSVVRVMDLRDIPGLLDGSPSVQAICQVSKYILSTEQINQLKWIIWKYLQTATDSISRCSAVRVFMQSLNEEIIFNNEFQDYYTELRDLWEIHEVLRGFHEYFCKQENAPPKKNSYPHLASWVCSLARVYTHVQDDERPCRSIAKNALRVLMDLWSSNIFEFVDPIKSGIDMKWANEYIKYHIQQVRYANLNYCQAYSNWLGFVESLFINWRPEEGLVSRGKS